MVCNAPRSSVIFDGIPTLSGLEGDMWALQLLTLNTSTSSASITFNFTNPTDRNGLTIFANVEVIEVVMFNCPARKIGTNSVQVSAKGQVADNIAVSESCDYLVRGCSTAVSLSLSSQLITLSFSKTSLRLYIAEITFYSSHLRQCSPVGPLNASVDSISEQTSTSSSNQESTSNKETHSPTLASETFKVFTSMDTTSSSNQESISNKETHPPTLAFQTSEVVTNMDTTSSSNQESTSNNETHPPTLSSETSKLVTTMDTLKLDFVTTLEKDISTNSNPLFQTIASSSEAIVTQG